MRVQSGYGGCSIRSAAGQVMKRESIEERIKSYFKLEGGGVPALCQRFKTAMVFSYLDAILQEVGSSRGGRWLAREVRLTGAAHLHGRQEQRAGRQAAWMSGRHSQGAAVAGPRPAASTAEPARLGPGRGPISMGLIRPAGTPGEWSAEIESVFSAPDTSDPVFPVYFNITL